ncbi:MAG: gliding motility lipoprotein GldH [Prevotellaceae bacterium]|nr:gliding motility lipoprotein GldH [Prevotellaceae bacterium]
MAAAVRRWAGVAALAVALAGCNRASLYDTVRTIPQEGWRYDSVAHFDVEVADTVAAFDFYFHLRHTTSYPFSNIYFFVKTTAPSGDFLSDTVEYMLADLYGRWLGAGAASIINNRLAYRKSVRFSQEGTYHVAVQQGMRTEALLHVVSVGLRIEKTHGQK